MFCISIFIGKKIDLAMEMRFTEIYIIFLI